MYKFTNNLNRVFLILSLFIFSSNSFSQVTLGASPYTQNFNGTTLPTGWSTRTSASATVLGTTSTPATTDTWSNSTAGFKFTASTKSPLTSSSNITAQNAATDRALAVRTSGTFGDPGQAFVLQIANTTGLSNFNLSFNAQLQDVQGRTTTYRVDYGIGATPSSFTQVGSTFTDLGINSGVWGSTNLNFSFGTALDNISQNVWIRIVSIVASTGSGSRCTFGIDDVSLTYSSTQTITSNAVTGNWSSTSSWVGGVVPTSADNAVIVSGANITMDNSSFATRNSGTSTTVNSGGTLATNVTYTNNGTTTINGGFQLNAGGWSNGSNFTYGASGTLIFNNTTSYGVNSGDVFWPTSNGPFNVTVLQGGLTLNSGANRTVAGTFQTAAGVTLSSATLTITGTTQLNAGGFFNNSPTYGSASTLVYNTSYGVSNEWTGNSTTAGVGVPFNVTIQNSSTVTMPNSNRGLAGSLNITSGNLTLNATSGDLYIAGNWTRASTASFTPNNRAVIYNGAGTQTITITGGGTVTYNYLIIDKASGNVQLSSSPATNMTINGSAGGVLQLNNTGSLDINGQTLTMSNNGGEIQVTAARTLVSTSSGGVLAITGNKSVTGVGTLLLPANVTTILTAGLNFGSNKTTVNNKLQISSGGFVDTNSPIYATSSTLEYNGVTDYGISNGWTGNATTAGNGTPHHVTLTNSSVIMPSGARALAGTLTIGTGSSMTLNGASGSDLSIGGNWINSGTFNSNSRLVEFRGTGAQTLTGTTTFDYLKMNNATGLTLQTASPVTVTTQIDLTSGKITLGANNFILGTSALFVNHSASSYLVTNSTGALVRNGIGSTARQFPVGLAASYTPLTIANTGTVNNLSLIVSSPPANAVSDATKIVNLQWDLTSAGAGAVADITFNWNAGNQGASYNATGTGELGNYTTGPIYNITSIGAMSGQTKAVTGISLVNGSNKLVLGNTGAVYTPPPANDNCSGAIALTLDAAAVTGNVAFATQSLPGILCAGFTGTANDDVWYSFTTTSAGTYTVTVVGSASFDAVVDLRSGACNGTNIFCADANGNGGTETIVATGLSAATTYYIRVYDYSSGYPATTTFTIAVASPPASLSTNGTTTLTFANQAPSTQSVSQTFNLSGTNLTGAPGNITVTAPNTNFQVSNNNSTWGPTTTIAYTTSTLAATPVYVRFTPQSSGAKSGNLTFSGGGVATPPTIALSGTGVLPAPVATAATNITAIPTFDANWNAVMGATSGYLLDVSTSPTFGASTPTNITEGFNAGITPPSGWTFSAIGGTYTTAGNFGASSPSLQFDATNDRVQTSVLSGAATQLTFWIKGQATDTSSALLVEGFNGTSWITIQNITNSIPLAGTTFTYNSGSSPVLPLNIVQFRFTYTKSVGNLAFDDVSINYNLETPNYVTGYNAKPIAGQATVTSTVTGLNPDTIYYYRLRATDGGTPSAYSNVITVDPVSRGGSVAANQTICSGATPANLTLSGHYGNIVRWESSLNTAFSSPTVIANTTTTLTGTSIGALTTNTYFRAVVQSGTNPIAYSDYATITVNPLPNGTLSNGGAVCSGTQPQLTFTASAGTAPFTLVINGQTYTNVQSGVAFNATGTAPTTNTTYTVTSITGQFCSNPSPTASTTVTVNPLPNGTLTNNGPVCAGTQPQLTFTASSGTAPFTLVINGQTYTGVVSGTPFTATGSAPTVTTTYSVTSITGQLCTNPSPTASTSVTVNPLPNGTLTNGGAVCAGTQPQLTFTASAGTGPFTLVINGQTYTGVVSGTPFTAAGTAPTVTTTYSITSITGQLCTNPSPTVSTSVTVNPLPNGTLTNGGAVCAGAQPQLIFTSSAGTAPFTLVINGQTYTNISSGVAFTATGTAPTTNTTYTVTNITGVNCNNPSPTASTSVTVNPLPDGTLTNGGTVCAGTQPQLIFTASSGVAPFTLVINGQTYTNINSGVAFTATGTAPTTNTTYTVTSITGVNCNNPSPTASTTVTVNPLPNGTLTNGESVCAGTQPQLTFTASSGVAPFTLVINGQTYTNISSGIAFTATGTAPTTSTTYTVESITGMNCTNLSPTVSTFVTVLPTNTAGAASDTPTVCVNTAIDAITHTTSGATGILNDGVSGANGLPAGVSATWSGDVITISGTPTTTVGSPFNYSIPLIGGCGSVNATGTITVSNDSIWTGNANTTDWNTAANWLCNTVPGTGTNVIIGSASYYPIITADVTINSLTLNSGTTLVVATNYDLTVTNAIVNNGTLTINNAANLLQVNNVANSGSGVTVVNRNSNPLIRLDYTLWSSPVSGQGLYAFSPSTFANRFYSYDSTINAPATTGFYNNNLGFNITGLDANGVNGTDTNNVPFATGKGYLIRLPWNHPTAATPTIYNGTFTGTPNNGTHVVAISNTGDRFNSVGNPYPSPISTSQFRADNNSKINSTIYFWRKTNSTSNPSYCSYNMTNDTYVDNGQPYSENPLGVIQTGQGFLVEAKPSGTEITFNNSQRIGDNANQFFRNTAVTTASHTTIESNRIWLNMTGASSGYSQTVVGYFTDATLGVDDSDSKFFNDGVIAFTSTINNADYVIQGRPLPFDMNDEVAMKYKVTTAGNYTISIDHADGFFANGQDVYLKDATNNTYHNLSTGSYTFVSEAGAFTNRFSIVYTSALSTNTPVLGANDIVIYKNENQAFVINSGAVTMKNIKVFDIRGRLLVTVNDINASQTTLSVADTNQVLLVQITSTEGAMITKKIIR